MTIREILSPADLEMAFLVVKELRPLLSFSDYMSLYEDAKVRDGFKLVGLFNDNICLAVIGYRLLFDFVHGKHLYIDDLIVTSTARSQGFGRQLLDFAGREAKELDCKGLRLCVGVDNEAGKKFYERNGWNPRSIAYKKQTGD
jgi:ribosomal protein S18 acetylase RimI-like enzyme